MLSTQNRAPTSRRQEQQKITERKANPHLLLFVLHIHGLSASHQASQTSRVWNSKFGSPGHSVTALSHFERGKELQHKMGVQRAPGRARHPQHLQHSPLRPSWSHEPMSPTPCMTSIPPALLPSVLSPAEGLAACSTQRQRCSS